MKSSKVWQFRLIGAAVLAVGVWVLTLGLDARDQRLDELSAWSAITAEIVRVEPHPRYDERFVQTFAFTAPGGALAECPVVTSPETVGEVGDTTILQVREETRTGACVISTGEPPVGGATGPWFLLLFGAAWIAMGGFFLLAPARRMRSGGGE
ncbi:MAG: hypothetical protein ABL308_01430 [Oceanicaulis sp.]